MEIEGLAAAVARVKLGGDVLTGAAAWIAAAGAQSVAQLEPDDIDCALSFALGRYSAERRALYVYKCTHTYAHAHTRTHTHTHTHTHAHTHL